MSHPLRRRASAKESRGGDWSKPYVFPAINRTLEGDKLYTLDPCPNEWYSYWCVQVVNGLCGGSPNFLYDRLVLYTRMAVDERLPVAERTEFTPTPKQMLYGQRAELLRVVATQKDAGGRVTEAFAEVELKESRGGDYSKPYVFPAINRTMDEGSLYTLDPCPNEWYAYWCGQVVNGL